MWILIPCKRLELAKLRLAPVLSALERRGLAEAMLSDVLEVAMTTQSIQGVMVVSSDPTVAKIAQKFGAKFFSRHSDTDLSFALTVARDFLQSTAVKGIMTISADLPRLSSNDINRVQASLGGQPGVSLAPATKDLGTNLIATSPASAIPYMFGKGSFLRHRKAARIRGFEPAIIRTPGLGFDIDQPEDLQEFVLHRSEGRTFQYLYERGIQARLLAPSKKDSSDKLAKGAN